MRRLLGVQKIVHFKHGPLTKSCGAYRALKRPLLRMRPLVDFQLSFCRRTYTTLDANVLPAAFIPISCSQRFAEIILDAAAVQHLHVGRKRGRRAKGGVAGRAPVGAQPGVPVQVVAQDLSAGQ